ncbi:MAG: hypothetical protein K0S93_67 [Nitrososphaeraceae archaeon]|jgi:hypothetical protein|nr:hypothetical protein [Nitrososphaeraceae archaeon]
MIPCEVCYKSIHYKSFEKLISLENYNGINLCAKHRKRYYGE